MISCSRSVWSIVYARTYKLMIVYTDPLFNLLEVILGIAAKFDG